MLLCFVFLKYIVSWSLSCTCMIVQVYFAYTKEPELGTILVNLSVGNCPNIHKNASVKP